MRLLAAGELARDTAAKMELDAAYDLVGADQIEAARQTADDVQAQILRLILVVAVPQRADARGAGTRRDGAAQA